jgi:hypothetical protein
MRTPAEQLRNLERGEFEVATPVGLCTVNAILMKGKGKEISQLGCSYRFNVLYG